MTTPFPVRVQVPLGLVKKRLSWGMPTLAVAILALLLVGPLLLWGKKAAWVFPLVVLVGIWLAIECKRDPDFLTTWGGELRLKGCYR